MTETPVSSAQPRRWLRRLVSAWLLFHVAAIIAAPAAVGPSSELEQSIARLFQPYVQGLFLNHGYRFFAPEPGPSTLVAYVVQRDGAEPVHGRFPHRGLRPRLLYHRYFMLTEHLSFVPPELEQQWYASYARRLCREHGGTQVGLTRVTHRLPTMAMVREGIRLDDPRSYEEQPLGLFRCE